eukprot:RCo010577
MKIQVPAPSDQAAVSSTPGSTPPKEDEPPPRPEMQLALERQLVEDLEESPYQAQVKHKHGSGRRWRETRKEKFDRGSTGDRSVWCMYAAALFEFPLIAFVLCEPYMDKRQYLPPQYFSSRPFSFRPHAGQRCLTQKTVPGMDWLWHWIAPVKCLQRTCRGMAGAIGWGTATGTGTWTGTGTRTGAAATETATGAGIRYGAGAAMTLTATGVAPGVCPHSPLSLPHWRQRWRKQTGKPESARHMHPPMCEQPRGGPYGFVGTRAISMFNSADVARATSTPPAKTTNVGTTATLRWFAIAEQVRGSTLRTER